jgi:pyrroline-5-carboxylate reductase
MGIAILSGVIDSLDTPSTFRDGFPKWESHTPGTLTPVQSLDNPDNSIPSRFLACVSRKETAHKLKKIFGDLGQLDSSVEVFTSNNVEPARRADVVLLWCDIPFVRWLVSSTDLFLFLFFFSSVVNPRSRMQF